MKSIITALILSLPIPAFSQKTTLYSSALSIEYDDVTVGRNFNLSYHYAIGKGWALYGGIKYHINRLGTPDNQHYTFDKRFYAENTLQHLGLKLGLEKALYRTGTSELFAFYDFQFTRAILRKTDYTPVGIDSTGTVYYTYGTYLFGPVTAFENTLGIGARFKLSKRIFMKGFIGGGLTLYTYEINDPVHNTALGGSGKDIEPCRMFGVGLEYRL